MNWEGLGVIVSLIGVFFTWRYSVKSREIAEEALDIEKQREERAREDRNSATVTADLIPRTDGSYNVEVRNHGPARASEIAVFLADILILEHERIEEDLGPSRGFTLSAGASANYRLSLAMGTAQPPFDVRVEWVDDRDRADEWVGVLTTP